MPKSPSLVPKIFHFSVFKFWKIKIFDLHVQYVHQMKAGDILNSNLLSKNTIVGKNFVKTGFSKFLLWILRRKKNFEGKFFGNFFLPPTNSCFPIVLNTKNEKYMKVWCSSLHPRQNGKLSKLLWVVPTPLRLLKV